MPASNFYCIYNSHISRLTVLPNKIPKREHCSGTHKLLGSNLGRALAELFKYDNTEFTTSLSEVCCLMRAYIVLDDFLKDNYVSTTTKNIILALLSDLSKEAQHILRYINNNDSEIWDKYLLRMNQGYYNFNFEKPYKSVIEKCSMVILLPLELIQNSENLSIVKYTRKYLSTFLFCLQLLDDFHDMEEDCLSPRNQNLFVGSISEGKRSLLFKGRAALLGPLLSLIQNNLNIAYKLIFSGTLLEKYHQNSIAWICNKQENYNLKKNNDLFPDYFTDFSINNSFICRNESILKDTRQIDISDIKAESMHTIKNRMY